MRSKFITIKRLVPSPTESDLEWARFCHQDVENLTTVDLWAERVCVTDALARNIYQRRERPVWCGPEGLITDRAWLIARLARLDTEASGRATRRGRAS